VFPSRRIKVSPALLVALVALVALGGTAVGGAAVNALTKQEKKQVKRISKKQARKQARKLDKRIELLPGPKGDPGTAAAYAHVRDDGTVVTSESQNITDADISHPETGVYCVSGPGFKIRHAQVTPEAYSTQTVHDRVAEILLESPFGCPSGTDLRVQIHDISLNALVDHWFYLLLED
jgi:hypothetical protein